MCDVDCFGLPDPNAETVALVKREAAITKMERLAAQEDALHAQTKSDQAAEARIFAEVYAKSQSYRCIAILVVIASLLMALIAVQRSYKIAEAKLQEERGEVDDLKARLEQSAAAAREATAKLESKEKEIQKLRAKDTEIQHRTKGAKADADEQPSVDEETLQREEGKIQNLTELLQAQSERLNMQATELQETKARAKDLEAQLRLERAAPKEEERDTKEQKQREEKEKEEEDTAREEKEEKEEEEEEKSSFHCLVKIVGGAASVVVLFFWAALLCKPTELPQQAELLQEALLV